MIPITILVLLVMLALSIPVAAALGALGPICNFIGVQLQIGSRTVREEIKAELRQIDERGEEQIKKHGDI